MGCLLGGVAKPHEAIEAAIAANEAAAAAQRELREIRAENEQLRSENAALRSRLSSQSSTPSAPTSPSGVHLASTPFCVYGDDVPEAGKSANGVEMCEIESAEGEGEAAASLPGFASAPPAAPLTTEAPPGADREATSPSSPSASRGQFASSSYSYAVAGGQHSKEELGGCMLCLEPLINDPREVINLCSGEPRCLCLVHRRCYLNPEYEMSDQLRRCMLCKSPTNPATVRLAVQARMKR
mmetsp:Transcript_41329/g.90243  ORF Transcript_41329/g.90243 Transcript_41329/m.90243 type:complete len:240 (+) Transcript_41329:102-821(+)